MIRLALDWLVLIAVVIAASTVIPPVLAAGVVLLAVAQAKPCTATTHPWL